jgi:uncharacterized protein (TIGR01777 family)
LNDECFIFENHSIKQMTAILLTGAGGMIGKALTKHLEQDGYTCKALVRDRTKADGKTRFFWDYLNKEIDLAAFENIDFIINLAGATVDHRWTKKYKQEIYDSRVASTHFLFETLRDNQISLSKFISTSVSGIYGDSPDRAITEDHSFGNDFLAKVGQDWEKAANQFEQIRIPTCLLRLGVVMAPGQGFIKRLSAPVKWGVGTHIGSGMQYISWLALSDLCKLFVFTLRNEKMLGAFNACTSTPLTLKEINTLIASSLHRKIILPNVPGWALKMVLGEMAEIVLTSCHMSNAKLKAAGFAFECEEFGDVLIG